MTRDEIRLKYKLQFERDISIALKVARSFEKEKQELIDKYYNLANKYADLADKYTDLKLEGKE